MVEYLPTWNEIEIEMKRELILLISIVIATCQLCTAATSKESSSSRHGSFYNKRRSVPHQYSTSFLYPESRSYHIQWGRSPGSQQQFRKYHWKHNTSEMSMFRNRRVVPGKFHFLDPRPIHGNILHNEEASDSPMFPHRTEGRFSAGPKGNKKYIKYAYVSSPGESYRTKKKQVKFDPDSLVRCNDISDESDTPEGVDCVIPSKENNSEEDTSKESGDGVSTQSHRRRELRIQSGRNHYPAGRSGWKRTWRSRVHQQLLPSTKRSASLVEGQKKLPCSCGKYITVHRYGRIKGGSVALKINYPWFVAISYSKVIKCGGSLINNRYVLTAGHCVSGFNVSDMDVYIDIDDKNKVSGAFHRKVVSAKVHEEYKQVGDRHVKDIALLRMDEEVDIVKDCPSICLPPPDRLVNNQRVTVVGFGITNSQNVSNVLLETKVTTLDRLRCLQISQYGTTELQEDNFCALDVGKDACQGDSGGPAMIKVLGRMEQIGIVSGGHSCSHPFFPGIYMSVTHHLQWIKKNTKDAKYCEN